MDEFTITSSLDGTSASFHVTRRNGEEVAFDVCVQCGSYAGRVSSTTYLYTSPCVMFEAMATEWNGWKGAKVWEDINRNLALSGTAGMTGHICLQMTLNDPDGTAQLKVALPLYAGELEGIAQNMAKLFG
jgi:hypothetical protein